MIRKEGDAINGNRNDRGRQEDEQRGGGGWMIWKKKTDRQNGKAKYEEMTK